MFTEIGLGAKLRGLHCLLLISVIVVHIQQEGRKEEEGGRGSVHIRVHTLVEGRGGEGSQIKENHVVPGISCRSPMFHRSH